MDITVTTPVASSATSAADQYTFVAPISYGDVVISPSSQFAYLTVPSQDQVAVLDLATGTFGTPIAVGPKPEGLDITPDGSTLYVCDSGSQAISVVDLATGQVSKTITTPTTPDSATPWQIAIGDNGTAIFTTTFAGSGLGAEAYLLNLTTGAITVASGIGLGGQVTEATQVARSADYSTAAVIVGDDASGPVSIYHFGTGTTVTTALNEPVFYTSLSGNGKTVLVDDGSPDFVLDGASGTLMGTVTAGMGLGIAVNEAGTVAYSVSLAPDLTGGSLEEASIARFLPGSSLLLPNGVVGSGPLALSPDGNTLVVLTSAGVNRALRRPAEHLERHACFRPDGRGDRGDHQWFWLQRCNLGHVRNCPGRKLYG